MAKYLSNIDLVGNQLQNAVIHSAGLAPTVLAEGQIYYNNVDNRLYVNIDGTSGGWLDVSGDIKEVIAGNGLTGGGSSDSVTIDVNPGAGIEIVSDEVGISLDAFSGLVVDPSFNTLKIKDGGTAFAIESPSGAYGVRVDNTSIEADGSNNLSLKVTGVTAGSYGSATAIPTFTVDADGRLTAAGEAAISTTLTVDADGATTADVNLGTDDLQIFGTSNEIETTVSKTGTDVTVQIGLPDDVTITNNLVVGGNLTVSGTTTTVNTETILLADNVITLNSNATGSATENAGIEVERGDDDNIELRWNETTDKWQIEVDPVNNTYENIATEEFVTSREFVATVSTSPATVTHNLGSTDVMVQLFDTSTLETVYADVVRATNAVTVTWTTAATLRVLIKKIG